MVKRPAPPERTVNLFYRQIRFEHDGKHKEATKLDIYNKFPSMTQDKNVMDDFELWRIEMASKESNLYLKDQEKDLSKSKKDSYNSDTSFWLSIVLPFQYRFVTKTILKRLDKIINVFLNIKTYNNYGVFK